MNLPEMHNPALVMSAGGALRLSTRWRDTRLALIWLGTVLPPFAAVLTVHRVEFFNTFVTAALTLQVWHIAFHRYNAGQSPFLTRMDICHAAILSLLLPLEIPLWQVVLSTSFGSVFGDRLFGGRGFAFLHPVVVALSFYLYSHGIGIEQSPASGISLIWFALAVVGLLSFELVSWRTLAGLVLGAVLIMALPVTSVPWSLLVSTPVLLVILFLIGDPAAGASTNPGRWSYGVLCGVLLVLLSAASAGSLAAVVYSALLASLAAPLIDYLVVQLHASRRGHRHG